MADGSAAVHLEPAGSETSAACAPVNSDRRAPAATSLAILHVLRAPVGGLFRHVLDIARGQAERGHRVGLVADTLTGGPRADAALAELAPKLAFGVRRVAISRQLDYSDLHALRAISPWIASAAPDVIHGHGAKGAALSRLTRSAPRAIRVYTPHGGTLVYRPGTLSGGFYRSLEWLLKWRTDLFLFESNFAAAQFRAQIGRPPGLVRVVHNGVSDDEFAPVSHPADATDIVALGELRPVKGFDLLIEALAMLNVSGHRLTATIAGAGPLDAELKAEAERLAVADQIRFVGHRTAREAFAMGRVMVLCSRAESLPYVVLEAAAAAMPMIATRVGGMPEIFGTDADHLVAPNSSPALAAAIGAAMADPTQLRRLAQSVCTRVRREFSAPAMVDGGLAAYREAIAMRKLAQFA
ncbi:MAG TPA: glycosyltransferase family 4 protein [Xanthobacteraceae bacterium]|jgi:glycosyltransferase involved in cell wall biosynthesis